MVKLSARDSNSSDQTLVELLQELPVEVKSLKFSAARLEDLMRILALPLLLSTLNELFKNGKQLRAYELSDGSRSTRQIGSLINVDQKRILRL